MQAGINNVLIYLQSFIYFLGAIHFRHLKWADENLSTALQLCIPICVMFLLVWLSFLILLRPWRGVLTLRAVVEAIVLAKEEMRQSGLKPTDQPLSIEEFKVNT